MSITGGFTTHFKLSQDEHITQFFPERKHDLGELVRSKVRRICHFLRTGVWINELKVCQWAERHVDEKLSQLFKGKAVERKLIRHEAQMYVEKPGAWTQFVAGVKFFIEFLKHPTKVGAILPSSTGLAKAIVKEIPKDLKVEKRVILEVGPGTGIFTDKIIQRMNPGDVLHLVEFDEHFYQELKEKYQNIPNVHVFHADIAQFDQGVKYDFIISGLPLNAFAHNFVEEVFQKFETLGKKGAKLSYFEYLVLPKIKMLFSNELERANLQSVLNIKKKFYKQHKLRKDVVYFNVPVARVLHHCLNERKAV